VGQTYTFVPLTGIDSRSPVTRLLPSGAQLEIRHTEDDLALECRPARLAESLRFAGMRLGDCLIVGGWPATLLGLAALSLRGQATFSRSCRGPGGASRFPRPQSFLQEFEQAVLGGHTVPALRAMATAYHAEQALA